LLHHAPGYWLSCFATCQVHLSEGNLGIAELCMAPPVTCSFVERDEEGGVLTRPMEGVTEVSQWKHLGWV